MTANLGAMKKKTPHTETAKQKKYRPILSCTAATASLQNPAQSETDRKRYTHKYTHPPSHTFSLIVQNTRLESNIRAFYYRTPLNSGTNYNYIGTGGESRAREKAMSNVGDTLLVTWGGGKRRENLNASRLRLV